MTTLNIGDVAPGFELHNQAGERVCLSDFRGRNVLLYFYPKADTPGCTIQSCAMRDAVAELAAKNIHGLGVSPDAPDALRAFDEKFGLGFPLLSDEDHAAAQSYGVWQEKLVYGKSQMGVVRSAFLIDGKGVLQGVWYKVKPEDTVPNALALFGEAS
ncbi:MAG: thioredoxin-dependent thiol peroxidase [Verrucomicrobia bacterium]|nr:thioredoxin-dependent thiol peroxidase [Verrucomicrobiota bacterium]